MCCAPYHWNGVGNSIHAYQGTPVAPFNLGMHAPHHGEGKQSVQAKSKLRTVTSHVLSFFLASKMLSLGLFGMSAQDRCNKLHKFITHGRRTKKAVVEGRGGATIRDLQADMPALPGPCSPTQHLSIHPDQRYNKQQGANVACLAAAHERGSMGASKMAPPPTALCARPASQPAHLCCRLPSPPPAAVCARMCL